MEPPLPSGWTPHTPIAIRRKVLTWFDKHQRPLPWRLNRDAYSIWVAEVMLQQTTVAAVLPHFEGFLKVFPTVQALAAASEQNVLKLWQGLGYYRRARQLHAAANQVVNNHGGNLSDEPDLWASLPGVGRYILGAVLSQAFERRLPIVEANTLRVFSRLFASRLDPRSGDGLHWVWAAAKRLLPKKRIGDFNQAMMELGALVCTPRNPKCEACPLRKECAAFAEGVQDTIPPAKDRMQTLAEQEVSIVLRTKRKILLCQRPANAKRWPMMWETPTALIVKGEEHNLVAQRIAESVGFDTTIGPEITTIRYRVTHFEITQTVFEAELKGGEFKSTFYTASEWRKPNEVDDLPLSTPQRKLMKVLASGSRPGRLF